MTEPAVRAADAAPSVVDATPPVPSTKRADRGPRVPGEVVTLPSSLSPSRAGDFMTCPLLYRFRVVDRLPEPPSVAATRGTLVHSVLEQLFDVPAAERTIAHATTLVAPSWRELLEAEPELSALFEGDDAPTEAEFLTGAGPLLDAYFTLEDPTNLEPAEREVLVEAPVGDGLLIRGYIDRLDVAPTGAMRVVDYKTGRAPGEGFEQKALFQMRFYALVLWKVHGRVPALLQLLYLGSGVTLRYEPDEADLIATERKVVALWGAIRSAAEKGDWRPRKSKLCGWCAHQSVCPEWGGTPPPLPVVQIGPPSPITPADSPVRAPEESP